jgi:FAD/FMN-containing dehydrogenase
MAFITKSFSAENELINHLKTHNPTFFFSSKTSTVIPYDKLDSLLPWDHSKGDFYLADLTKMPSHMSLTAENHLKISGAVSWQEASQFLSSQNRAIMTSPTEQLALVLAGVATSCTGERCFGFGNLRSQVISLKYLNFKGEKKELKATDSFGEMSGLSEYQKTYQPFSSFKNAPFPRFEKSTDLLIGTEGQLGVITEAVLKTAPLDSVTYMFLLLPRFEDDIKSHLEVYHKVQGWRESILACELLDSNSMKYLPEEDRLGQNQDIIFLEVKSDQFENVFENFLQKLTTIKEDQIFEISKAKYHTVRASVPRAIFETNSKMGVTKIGTDAQVSGNHFEDLLLYYRDAAKLNVRYSLFGHFGDGHLHFNYMPDKADYARCLNHIESLYPAVLKWGGSPFAEHGIGLLKQKYIKYFYSPAQSELFKNLKKEFDPHGQFFPQGFMHL